MSKKCKCQSAVIYYTVATSATVCVDVSLGYFFLWGGGLSANIIGIEYSSLKNINTEPTPYQVPQRATQPHNNRYMENQADIKQRLLNRITRRGGRWEGGSKICIHRIERQEKSLLLCCPMLRDYNSIPVK